MSFAEILAVLALAASPVSELRGAIPLAILGFHMPWYYAVLLAVIGNLLPVPFILLFLDALRKLLSRISVFKRLMGWYFARAERRSGIIEKYGVAGLALFVAIPLPLTGAWTGSLIAVLLKMPFGRAFLSISAGVAVAGLLVTGLTLLGRMALSP